MNVLVYSGSEVLQTSLTYTLSTLRALLLPNYSVQTISAQSLISHPWSSSCALLVLPAFKTAPTISTPLASAINLYVDNGGSLLAIGAGAQLQDSRSTLEGALGSLSIVDVGGLRFFDRTKNRYIVPKFGSSDDKSAQPAKIRLQDGSRIGGILHHEGKPFFDETLVTESTVLAHYDLGDDTTPPAVVCYRVHEGRIVFSSLRLDIPVEAGLDAHRKALLQKILVALGHRVPAQEVASPTRPPPQFLTSIPSRPDAVTEVLTAFGVSLSDKPYILKDSQDMFHFHRSAEGHSLLQSSSNATSGDSDPNTWQPKHIAVYTSGSLPSPSATPSFNLQKFCDALSAARTQAGYSKDPKPWGMGEVVLYGEAVTSTQTLLDKNTHLLSHCPTPFLSLASRQLAGRGRGSNVWLSPAGCLQFSLLLRVSTADVPAPRLVFIQYLFAVAVAEACRDSGVLGTRGEQVRLKWPNDIYVTDIGEQNEKKKIGGILVNMNFSGTKVEVVIGCGLNVLNAPPIASLSQLLLQNGKPIDDLSIERTAATIMAKFERMWDQFVAEKGSFDSFMDLYLDRWLHSDQLVTLTTVNPPQKVRITGITSDHGLLRTIPQTDSWVSAKTTGFIDLQPDGNSFDLMEGLIKAET